MRDHPFAKHGYRWGLVVVLTAGLLVAALLGIPGDSDQAVAKEPRATIGRIMVPASAFTPTRDDWDYQNLGWELRAFGVTSRFFTAALWFPESVVTIRKITLIAYDATASASACVNLYRAQPLTGDESLMGSMCTADSPDNPQKVATTAISPRRVNTAVHGPYLWLAVGQGVYVYGVQVVYTY